MTEPSTLPAGDRAEDDPLPMFRMKSDLADATTAGSVRLLADGEGLSVAWLSFVGTPGSNSKAMGLASYDWQGNTYQERWARVVEGPHFAQPAAWAYDELRWREQAIRPFFARDSASGDLLVGRAWNNSRCAANRRVFGEFTQEQCVLGTVGTAENERLPLAITRFGKTGTRRGTIVVATDANAAEQIAFALVARQGSLLSLVLSCEVCKTVRSEPTPTPTATWTTMATSLSTTRWETSSLGTTSTSVGVTC